jgi:NADPH:quinone reductase
MRAIQIDEFNGPLKLREVPTPVAGLGERLITLTHAAVNPLDVVTCQGSFAAMTPLPHIPGAEGLGRDAAGVLGIVHGSGIGLGRPGTYAEAVLVPDAAWIPIPEGLDPAAAVSMGIAGITAHRCVVGLAHTTPDDIVLVLGASGGVGSIAVQLARNLGATVLGQTSSKSKSKAIEALGAEVLLAADGHELLSALKNRKVGIVIDGLGGTFTAASISALKPFGKLISYGTSSGVEVSLNLRSLYRNSISLIGYSGLALTATDRAGALGNLFAQLAKGHLKVEVETLPLCDAGEAHRRILEKQVVGKLVLDVRA